MNHRQACFVVQTDSMANEMTWSYIITGSAMILSSVSECVGWHYGIIIVAVSRTSRSWTAVEWQRWPPPFWLLVKWRKFFLYFGVRKRGLLREAHLTTTGDERDEGRDVVEMTNHKDSIRNVHRSRIVNGSPVSGNLTLSRGNLGTHRSKPRLSFFQAQLRSAPQQEKKRGEDQKCLFHHYVVPG